MSGDNLHGNQPIKFYSEKITLTKIELLESVKNIYKDSQKKQTDSGKKSKKKSIKYKNRILFLENILF